MTPEPPIRIDVDLTNPGQFFACCGLLEIADRLWNGAEGWFEGEHFNLTAPKSGSVLDLLAFVLMDPPEELTQLDNGIHVKPLIAPLRFSFDGGATTAIVLDTWMTIATEKRQVVAKANPPWNFWAGQQTSLRIWQALRAKVVEQLKVLSLADTQSLFSHRALLSGRFGFDPGASWNALDVGFSPNEQKIAVASSAALELLAAIGIQRFRPRMASDRRSFVYATWGCPLTPSVAAATVCGAFVVPPSTRFQGRVINRGSYAALGRFVPYQGDYHA